MLTGKECQCYRYTGTVVDELLNNPCICGHLYSDHLLNGRCGYIYYPYIPSERESSERENRIVNPKPTEQAGVLKVARKDLDSILALARKEYPVMACGLLGGTNNQVLKIFPAKNVDKSRYTFVTDPHDLLQALDEIDSKGWEFLGIYYSQADGSAYPSAKTVSDWSYSDVACFIISFASLGIPEMGVFDIVEGVITRRRLVVIEQ